MDAINTAWNEATDRLASEGYRATFEYPGFILIRLSNNVDLSVGTANETITMDATDPDGVSVADSFDTLMSSQANDPTFLVHAIELAIAHFERLFDATAKGNEDESLTDYQQRTSIDVKRSIDVDYARRVSAIDPQPLADIASLLDGRSWSVDDLDTIAEIVRSAGFPIAGPENGESGSVADSANRFHRSHGGDAGVLPIDCAVCVDRFDDRPINYRTGDRRMADSDLCDAIADRMIALGVGESETGDNSGVAGANTGGGIYCVFFPVKDRPNLQWMAGMGGDTWGADLIARESGEYLQFDKWTNVSSDSQDVDAIAVALKAIADSTDVPSDEILFDNDASIERWKEKTRDA